MASWNLHYGWKHHRGLHIWTRLIDNGFKENPGALAALPSVIYDALPGLTVYTGTLRVRGDLKPTNVLVYQHVDYTHYIRVVMTLNYEPKDGPIRNRLVRRLRDFERLLRPENWLLQRWFEFKNRFAAALANETALFVMESPLHNYLAAAAAEIVGRSKKS